MTSKDNKVLRETGKGRNREKKIQARMKPEKERKTQIRNR